MNTIPITQGAKAEEYNGIKTIAVNNGYHKIATKLHTRIAQIQNKVKYIPPKTSHENREIKWTKFTYLAPRFVH
jgi:hypothetical protein